MSEYGMKSQLNKYMFIQSDEQYFANAKQQIKLNLETQKSCLEFTGAFLTF